MCDAAEMKSRELLRHSSLGTGKRLGVVIGIAAVIFALTVSKGNPR
jgi:hypothetical protein